MYNGVIIKETLTDELFLDHVVIDKVEIAKTNGTIKYWTMVFFHSDTDDLPQRLANTIIEGWFADMKSGNVKYVIFRNKVLQYEKGNNIEIENVMGYMRSRGIPESQIAGSIKWSD